MLPKAEVEARLMRLGAFWSSDVDEVHQLWVTGWGFEIQVPIAGPMRGMYEDDLIEIEQDIINSRP